MDQSPLNGARNTRGRHRISPGVMGFGVVDAALEFGFRRHANPNEHMAVSVGAAGATAAAWMFLPGVMWAKTAFDVSKGVGTAVDNFRRNGYEEQLSNNSNLGRIGGNFNDTDYTATSRQRGMQAIQSSRLNARSALANEARSLHRF